MKGLEEVTHEIKRQEEIILEKEMRKQRKIVAAEMQIINSSRKGQTKFKEMKHVLSC
jgi:hypothetical protein